MSDEVDVRDMVDESEPVPKNFDMPENWQESMLAFYEQGWTNEEVTAWIAKYHTSKGKKFSQNTFASWARRVPIFRDIVEIGTLYKKAWWLSQGRTNIGNGKFNTPLYIRMMSNLFAWRTDSSVIESVGEKVDLSKLSDEELALYRKLRDKMKEVKEAGSSGIAGKPQYDDKAKGASAPLAGNRGH